MKRDIRRVLGLIKATCCSLHGSHFAAKPLQCLQQTLHLSSARFWLFPSEKVSSDEAIRLIRQMNGRLPLFLFFTRLSICLSTPYLHLLLWGDLVLLLLLHVGKVKPLPLHLSFAWDWHRSFFSLSLLRTAGWITIGRPTAYAEWQQKCRQTCHFQELWSGDSRMQLNRIGALYWPQTSLILPTLEVRFVFPVWHFAF